MRPAILLGMTVLREGLLEAVAGGKRLRGWRPMGLPGDLGLTIEFLNHFPPAQALLAGTSSFRLDRMDLYLSTAGAADV